MIGADPTRPMELSRWMDASMRGHPYVKSPLDVACWDILGQATGQPVCVLLGGRYGNDFALYRAISQESPEDMAASCREHRAAGYTKFQLKVGGDPDTDIERSPATSGCSRRVRADAAHSTPPARSARPLRRAALERAQRRREPLRPHADAVVCPCEGATVGQVSAMPSQLGLDVPARRSRPSTRCGMGPCQGRYCEPLVEPPRRARRAHAARAAAPARLHAPRHGRRDRRRDSR
ncbi:MAG: hypothetical protein U5K43_08490 [Halofilum sp. (in: g-proteobacteria)]|nr:hypothetical protein [Halofilum sp. (in: g-proteobacteria)]